MARDDRGNVARQMAAAPLPGRTGDPSNPTPAPTESGETISTTPTTAKNRFAGLFGVISFKAVPKPRKPYVFPSGVDAGTEQETCAEVIFENIGGIPGANQMGYRIVKRVSADKKRTKIVCVPPQFKIGPISHPFLNLKEADEDVKEEYAAQLNNVLVEFKAWATKRKNAGLSLHDGKAAASGAGAVEDDIDSASLASLGL